MIEQLNKKILLNFYLRKIQSQLFLLALILNQRKQLRFEKTKRRKRKNQINAIHKSKKSLYLMSFMNVFHHNQFKRQEKMKMKIINFFLRIQSTLTKLFPVLEKNCYSHAMKIFKKIMWIG